MKKTKEEIGAAGEELVALVYKKYGHDVLLNEDKYDDRKDMVIDKIFTEIKTQTIYRFFECDDGVYRPAFTVDIQGKCGKIYHNQLNKCKAVDKLIFVARSSRNDPVVRIYEAPDKENRNFRTHRNKKDGRLVAGILIEDMTLIREIRNTKIVEFFMDDWRSNANSKRH